MPSRRASAALSLYRDTSRTGSDGQLRLIAWASTAPFIDAGITMSETTASNRSRRNTRRASSGVPRLFHLQPGLPQVSARGRTDLFFVLHHEDPGLTDGWRWRSALIALGDLGRRDGELQRGQAAAASVTTADPPKACMKP